MTEALPYERKHDRVQVRLMGRYMLADRTEHRCTVIDVALGGVALSGPQAGAIGEPVVVYIDQLGRVQGNIVRFLNGGFALALTNSTAATKKLADRLEQLASVDAQMRERRRDVRVEPHDLSSAATLSNSDDCEIVDISLLGAEIKVGDPLPALGTLLRLGRLHGRVVRHSAQGVGVEFIDAPEPATLADRWMQISSPTRRADTAA